MKLLIVCSKSWFKLREDIKNDHSYKIIINKNDLTLKFLKSFEPDYIFFPHWSWIVSKDIYKNYKCIVFHTAPLPYGRGGSPIQNLILNGFENSPVCAIKMTKKLDSGPIYAKKSISLSGSLNEILHRINRVINELIHFIVNNNIVPSEQETDILPTVFRRLTENDNIIPKEISLQSFYDRVRMLDHPSYPDAYIKFGSFKLEFSEAKLGNAEVKLTCKVTKC